MRGRIARGILVAALLVALSGCRISRNIRDLSPVTDPPLTELERNLDYSDPDDGRANYIFGS